MGRVYLGLTSFEFWDTTPLEYTALCERHSDMQDGENFRSFSILAGIINSNRSKGSDKVWQATDFFTPHAKATAAKPAISKTQDIAATWEMWMTAYDSKYATQ